MWAAKDTRSSRIWLLRSLVIDTTSKPKFSNFTLVGHMVKYENSKLSRVYFAI